MAHNDSLSLIPAYSVHLQAQKGLQGEEKVTPLGSRFSIRGLLHTAPLLEAPAIGLDSLGLSPQSFSLGWRHLEIAGSPMLHVSIFRDHPKHLNEFIALQVHPSPTRATLPFPSGLTCGPRNRFRQTSAQVRGMVRTQGRSAGWWIALAKLTFPF
jgi:hypothetical protein